MKELSPQKIKQEIQMAKIEKRIETLEAENFALRQEIKDLENMVRGVFPPLTEPVEVIGSWVTTGNGQQQTVAVGNTKGLELL